MMINKLFMRTMAFFSLACAVLLTGPVSASGQINSGNLCGKSVSTVGANGLQIKKDVFCTKDRLWGWTISKSVDQSNLILALGQQATVNYTVVARTTATETNFAITGNIFIRNGSSAPVTLASVADNLTPVNCGVTFPYRLQAGFTLGCTYSQSLNSAINANVATVSDSNGMSVSTIAPIDWSKAAVNARDECADVTDTFTGPLGTLCAGQQTGWTFNYSRTIGPYNTCVSFTIDNIASFVTNDSGTTGSASQLVNGRVSCANRNSISNIAKTLWKRKFDWTLSKTVASNTWNLLEGQTGTSTYTISVTKTLELERAALAGIVCLYNGDTLPTQNLSVLVTLTMPPSPAVIQSAAVDVSSNPVLDPGETGCYNYLFDIASPQANAVYQTNASAISRGVTFAPAQSVTLALPAVPDVVLFDTVTVTDSNGSTWIFGDSGSVSYDKTFACNTDQGTFLNTATILGFNRRSSSAAVTVNCSQ